MIVLRRAHLAGQPADGPAIRALALRYPGALRELDRAPLEVLVERHALLVAGPLPSWAEPTHALHQWLASALRVRRAAGRDRDRDRAELAWASEAPSLGGEPADLDFLLDPPAGRLSEWVVSRVAAARNEPVGAVREVIFGHLARGW